MLKTIERENSLEMLIKNSKFIAYTKRIKTINDAKKYIAEIKNTHPKANHHCYGYKLENNTKYDDDNEPNMTAGLPIIETITQNNLTETIIIVVRYFGGVKLGRGGLIRAYRKTAQKVIASAKLKLLQQKSFITVCISHHDTNVIKYKYASYISDIKYSNNVEIFMMIPTDEVETIKKAIVNITKNNCSFKHVSSKIC